MTFGSALRPSLPCQPWITSEPKAWTVPFQALPRVAAPSPTLSRSSAAARVEKVSAGMRDASTPDDSRCSILPTRVAVFPVPGPDKEVPVPPGRGIALFRRDPVRGVAPVWGSRQFRQAQGAERLRRDEGAGQPEVGRDLVWVSAPCDDLVAQPVARAQEVVREDLRLGFARVEPDFDELIHGVFPRSGLTTKRRARKKGGLGPERDQHEALGRSRGGYSTKACMICDGRGRPVAFRLVPGQEHESLQAGPLLADLGRAPQWVVAEKDYAAYSFRGAIWNMGSRPAAPTKSNEAPVYCPA